MEKNIDLKKIEQKAYHESVRDGLAEIFWGITFIAATGYFLIRGFSIFMILLVLVIIPIARKKLKEQYVYPRIGYAKLREDGLKEIAGILLYMTGVVIVMATAFFLVYDDLTNSDLWLKWSPMFFGAILTGAYLDICRRSGNRWYYGIAVLALVSGVTLSVLEFASLKTSIIVYLPFMGTVLILTGSVLFRRFLKNNPVREETSDDI
ncbi:MAG TPA: hypothetical protein ENI50_00680 [Euryarchaeota archaeon]|nr:hypothetical protein [Euryarchaeota archaeon]